MRNARVGSALGRLVPARLHERLREGLLGGAMVRICAWCRRVIGVKCPACGREALIANEEDGTVVMVCAHCGGRVVPGEGGVTHGICEDCRPR